MENYNIDITDRAKKALKKLVNKDNELLAEINNKIIQLAKGNHELLDLKPIKRKKKKYNINEIRIKSPISYRVFYVHIFEKNNNILIVDGRKKKVSKFKSKYFDQLDLCITEHRGGK